MIQNSECHDTVSDILNKNYSNFIEIATAEYEEISSLCNYLALVTRSIASCPPNEQTNQNYDCDNLVIGDNQSRFRSTLSNSICRDSTSSSVDTIRIKKSRPSYYINKYHKCLETIRELHQELNIIANPKHDYYYFTTKQNEEDKKIKSHSQIQSNQPSKEVVIKRMEDHIHLSKRVIRTCTVEKFDRMGMVRDSMDQYDYRTVALTALNASIKRLEAQRWETSSPE